MLRIWTQIHNEERTSLNGAEKRKITYRTERGKNQSQWNRKKKDHLLKEERTSLNGIEKRKITYLPVLKAERTSLNGTEKKERALTDRGKGQFQWNRKKKEHLRKEERTSLNRAEKRKSTF